MAVPVHPVPVHPCRAPLEIREVADVGVAELDAGIRWKNLTIKQVAQTWLTEFVRIFPTGTDGRMVPSR